MKTTLNKTSEHPGKTEEAEERRELAIEERADELKTGWCSDPAELAAILDRWRETKANEAAYQNALSACLRSTPGEDPATHIRRVLNRATESSSLAEATRQIDQEIREGRIEYELERRELLTKAADWGAP